MYHPYGVNPNTPRRAARDASINLGSLQPVESLNPDHLKDLTKQDLTAYLRAYSIIPGASKPEMKKQMRTLIHSINNNTALPASIMTPQPKPQDLASLSGLNFNQLANAQVTAAGSTTPQMMPMNHPLMNQQMSMGSLPMPPFMQQNVNPYMMNAAAINPSSMYATQTNTQSMAPMPYLTPTTVPSATTPIATTPLSTAQSPIMTPSKHSSPPGSPRTKDKRDTAGDEQAGDLCLDCSKKSNKECNNRRCRSCCVKYMLDTKSLCLVHIKDESRRPRTKEHPHSETIQSLILQAQQQYPNFSISTSNTPATQTPQFGATPAGSLTPAMEPLSLGVSPVLSGVKTPTKLNLASVNAAQPAPSNVAVPLVPPQPAAVPVQPQPELNKENEYTSANKAHSLFQLAFINIQAMYMQQIANNRLVLPRDEKFAFFQCFKCDKLLSVNGSSLWKHLQSDHPNELIPFLKDMIQSDNNIFTDSQDILVLSKSKANERYNEKVEWLEEIFAPVPSTEINEKDYHLQRIKNLRKFQSTLQTMMNTFDSSQTSTDTIKNESSNFYNLYNQLSTTKSLEELETLSKQIGNLKDIHFEQNPSLITQLIPSYSEKNPKTYYDFIENESSFTIQSI